MEEPIDKEEEFDKEEVVVVELKDVNVKDALNSFENVKAFIERSEFYNALLISFIRKSHNPERLFPPEQFRINGVRV